MTDSEKLQAACLLDDVIKSIESTIKASRYTQLWDESVPLEAWLEDCKTAFKLLGVNL